MSQIDLGRLRVLPLTQRKSLTSIDDILINPDSPAPAVPDELLAKIDQAAQCIANARRTGASVMLIYGAHLLRNGAALILERMMSRGWLTHLATNGAGSIHDWEYAFLGRSTENVRENVATGTFGAWDETCRNICIALLAAGINNEGYGRAIGRFIAEDGVTLPDPSELEEQIRRNPADPLTPARAELLSTMRQHTIPSGPYRLEHRWKHTSIFASAFRHNIPLTVHPGIGYDIITVHPMFNGAAIGRAAQRDFSLFCDAVDRLDNGVVLSIGSAIMGPQVFEKSLSCVNNLRLQRDRSVSPPRQFGSRWSRGAAGGSDLSRSVSGHSIYVVDLQPSGGWDWSQGEPPKQNPAYYLRFCKSYCRMGGQMHYLQSDNIAFIHNLFHRLSAS